MLSRHAALPPQHHAPHCAPLTSAVRVAACVLMVASSTPAAAEEQPLPTDQYFEEYGQLYDHVGMLQDHVRMGAYYDAIRLNAARHFKGKVVLDVGAGTGVLSIWAAKAGARRVFAVEATGVATHAEALVRAHGLSDVVTVLRGRMEQLELPEKVDVILSEWMGYFLLRESMVSSVLYARDKWLRPGGAMYPSEARLLLAPMSEPGYLEGREASVEDTMENWDALSSSLSDRYGLKMEALREAYLDENVDYAYRQAWQGAIGTSALVGAPAVLLDVDMHTVTDAELFGWSRTVSLPKKQESEAEAALSALPVGMLCGWFDVRFCAGGDAGEGEGDGGSSSCVELSTSPKAPYTHWAQTTLVLDPPLAPGGQLAVGLTQLKRSHHDLNLTLTYVPERMTEEVSASYAITAEFRTGERSSADYTPDDDDDDSIRGSETPDDEIDNPLGVGRGSGEEEYRYDE